MTFKEVRSWCLTTTIGALVLGFVCGLLIAFIAVCAISGANAGQSKTLTLNDEYVQGDTRICVYEDAARVETVEIRKAQHCKSVLTVDIED